MRRNRIKELGLTPEKLAELYEAHTDIEIAAQLGVTDAAISYFRRRWGIVTKSQRQRADEKRGGLTLEALTPARLAELYVSMGDESIGKLYGVTKPVIRALRQRWGIEAISKSTRATSCEELTEEQKEACIGTLLGDAHLLDRGALKVSHYQEQVDYLKHLHQLLHPHVLPITYEEKLMDNGRLTFGFSFKTVQHEWFKAIYPVFYPDGVRIFPESVLRELMPRSLAFWYFDDGHLGDGLPELALGVLTDAQFSEVLQLVGTRFSLSLYERAPAGNCRRLGVRASSSDRFFELIRDFVTQDMLYKLPVKHWPKGSVPRQPIKTPEPTMLPKALVEEAKLWKTLDADAKEALLETFFQFWSKIGFPYHTPRPEELTALLNLDQQHVIQDGVIKARQVGQGICQGIITHIWEGRSYDSESPLALFQSPEKLRELLRFIFESGDVPNANRLRSAIRYWRRGGVYNFRPSAAKALVDRFCCFGGTVLDPCAGYGGRLLGTLLSASQARYVGFDPSTRTIEGLQRLHHWVGSYLPTVKDRVTLHGIPAETGVFPANVDMVLTSPPYWKREIYSEEPSQSAAQYPTYAAWLDGFWRPVIAKSVAALRPGGWLVLNVDDFSLSGRDYKLIEDTCTIVADLGLGKAERFEYQLPNDKTEDVLCWAKGSVTLPEPAPEVPLVRVSSCAQCGKAASEDALHGGICLECLTPKRPPVVCKGCGKLFQGGPHGGLFHDDNCYARYNRKQRRAANPLSGVRTFTCQGCSKTWETKLKGRFKFCPDCQDKREVEGRVKRCGYRHCEHPEFVDTSGKNSMSYCCVEHRRREKMFRSGSVTDPAQFRGPNRR